MSLDPYQTLDVPKDADQPTIKKAFRRKAAKHHPDKGGQTEAFLAVQRAYDILSDDERRQRFDRYGDTEEQDLEMEAHKTLIRTVRDMATAIQNPRRENIIELARGFIQQRITEARVKIAASRKRIKRWQDIIKRTKTRKPADNFLVAAFNGEIAGEESTIKNTELSIEIGGRMLKLLENFEYVVDKEPELSTPFMPKSLFESFTYKK